MTRTRTAINNTLLGLLVLLLANYGILLASQTRSLGLAAATHAEAAEPYYQGKRINLLIGTRPGSSFDTQARLIAKHLAKYVPGSPSIIPQNMGGGGAVTMMNHLYNVADRDGTAMGMVVGGVYMRHLFGTKGIRHDLSKMIPIYNPEGGGAVIFASTKLGLREPGDIVKVGRPVTFGYQTAQGNSVVLGFAGFKMLGVEVKGVGGYGGSAEVNLAVERDELDIGWNTTAAWTSIVEPKVKAGIFFPIFQSGLWRPKEDKIVPASHIPEVPTFDALYRQIKGKDPSGPLWEAWFMPLISYGRGTIFFPPGVPARAIEEMTKGFEQMCRDSSFIADYKKLDIDPTCYLREDAKRITERSSKAPAEAVNALKAILPRK